MSLMESYLMVTCPVKGCSLHVESPMVDSQLTNPNVNRQTQWDSRSSEFGLGLDSVVKQLDFWHSKIDH